VELRDYLRVLRARWRLILLCTLLAVGAAAAATYATTPVYQAEAQLFVSTTGGESDSVGSLQQGNQFAQARVRSYANIVNTPIVLEDVVDELGLSMDARRLASRVQATAPLDTVLINVTASDPDPALAQAIANATADRFSEVAAELETPEGGGPSPVSVTVVRPADLPETPSSPRPTLNLALGLLVGLAVGVGAALLRDALDTSVKTVATVQEELGLSPLGIIGYDADATRRPLIVHAEPGSTRAEAFRQLRTNLRFIDVDRPPRSIVVTSAGPAEGKSTTTANLAIALSQAGERVILVEGDLRRPRIAQYLGLEGAIGLTDVLVGRADLDDVLQPWGDGTLRVLASGPTPPNPSELLGSHQMEELLKRMEDEASLVLIDAPPLLPVTDGAVLARQASGAVLVIRAGKTTKDSARRALETMQSVDAHVYGAVLTMVPTKGPDAYRYGYYGYGYTSQRPEAQTAPR
jgi:polysaccharide biosynthesis transport protein